MPEKDDDVSFKVRDKRLFNPDGTLRESSDEEEVAPASAARPATASQPSGHTAGAHLEPEIESSDSPPHQQHEHDTEPLEFINFIYGLASNAFANLGMMTHPVTGETTVDLETAKHFIDIIGLLEKKTKGNLSAEESKMMSEILGDLRMQYVSLINAPKK